MGEFVSGLHNCLETTTMFTYSHANTPFGQSERAYYLNYFIKIDSFILNRAPKGTCAYSDNKDYRAINVVKGTWNDTRSSLLTTEVYICKIYTIRKGYI